MNSGEITKSFWRVTVGLHLVFLERGGCFCIVYKSFWRSDSRIAFGVSGDLCKDKVMFIEYLKCFSFDIIKIVHKFKFVTCPTTGDNVI